MCVRGVLDVSIKKLYFRPYIYIYIYIYIYQYFTRAACQTQLFYSSLQRTAKIHLTVKSNKKQNVKCACGYKAVSKTSFRINQN